MREGDVIEYIRKKQNRNAGVIVGIGDDAAVIKSPGPGRQSVVACDVVVEKTHFTRKQGTPEQWGRKSVCVNVSDFAAMGADPQYLILGIGLPKDINWTMTRQILDGILQACKDFGITVIGGDTVRSELISISVTLIGKAGRDKAVTRSGMRKGDVLFISGPLGNSYRSQHHLNFNPRISESEYLLKHYDVHAMIDISDGLAKDLQTLTAASGIGASVRLTAIPLREGASIRNALYDGEDFELLFALSEADAVKLLSTKKPGRKQFDFYPIGTVGVKGGRINWFMGEEKVRVEKPKDHHFNS